MELNSGQRRSWQRIGKVKIGGPKINKGCQYAKIQRGGRWPKLDVNPAHNVINFLALTKRTR